MRPRTVVAPPTGQQRGPPRARRASSVRWSIVGATIRRAVVRDPADGASHPPRCPARRPSPAPRWLRARRRCVESGRRCAVGGSPRTATRTPRPRSSPSRSSRAASRSSTWRCVGQGLLGSLVRAIDDLAHLGVDLGGDLVGVVPLLADLAAQEDHLVLLAEGQRAEPLAHAVLLHHRAGQAGRLLDVVARRRWSCRRRPAARRRGRRACRRSCPRTRSCVWR